MMFIHCVPITTNENPNARFRQKTASDGHVKNEEIRAEALDAYTMETNLELRRCRWLEKIANMGENRMPRKLLAAFCHGKTRRQGKSKATIRHGYVDTLKKLARLWI